MRKTSKISVFLVVVAMIATMFGGLVFADEANTATTTVSISSISSEIEFIYNAKQDEVLPGAKKMANKLGQNVTDEELLEMLNVNEDGTIPVSAKGTVEYSADSKALAFKGEGTVKVFGIEVAVEKEVTLPVKNIVAAVSIDGSDYTASYSEETGVLTIDYVIPFDVTDVEIILKDFVADTTYNDQPGQVIYSVEGSDATATFVVDGTVRHTIINPSLTAMDAKATVDSAKMIVTAEINATGTGIVLTYTMEADEDGLAGFIERLYTIALERRSDNEGKAAWINAVENEGYTGADVARGFLFSDEFLGNGASDEEFVDILYKVFFNRIAEPAGKETWLNALAEGMSKEDVIDGFINTPEWVATCDKYGIESGANVYDPTVEGFVTRLYKIFLGRKADAEGFNTWTTLLKDKTITGSLCALGFVFSEEYMAKELSNEEYVANLYIGILGRPCDEEAQTWIDLLDNGEDKMVVFQGFVNSPEFAALCASFGIDQ